MTEQNRPVSEEEVLGDALGQDVSRVVPGGDTQEDDGEAGDAPSNHGITSSHPAGVLADLFARSALLNG